MGAVELLYVLIISGYEWIPCKKILYAHSEHIQNANSAFLNSICWILKCLNNDLIWI